MSTRHFRSSLAQVREAAFSHLQPTENVIRRGDVVMLELTRRVLARYNFNIVRTVVAGEATTELLELQGIVRECPLTRRRGDQAGGAPRRGRPERPCRASGL